VATAFAQGSECGIWKKQARAARKTWRGEISPREHFIPLYYNTALRHPLEMLQLMQSSEQADPQLMRSSEQEFRLMLALSANAVLTSVGTVTY